MRWERSRPRAFFTRAAFFPSPWCIGSLSLPVIRLSAFVAVEFDFEEAVGRFGEARFVGIRALNFLQLFCFAGRQFYREPIVGFRGHELDNAGWRAAVPDSACLLGPTMRRRSNSHDNN